MVKNPPADAGDITDEGSIPGSERSPAEGNGNPLQYSCLENLMGRGAWQASVYRVTQSQTRRDLECILDSKRSWTDLYTDKKRTMTYFVGGVK